MKSKQKNLILIVLLSLAVFLGTKYTEYRDQVNRLTTSYKIAPPTLPNNLAFAGEQVPFDKFEIKERLDREIMVNTFWQSSTLLILKRSKKVFSVIEPILEEHGIPDDFKYLAVAESSLVNATSSAGAKGIWQFMASSGKAYGLEINDDVDERYNLELSTEAACIYLKEAYDKFGSWTLAAAAYNRGISGIQYDLTKQNVNDYYDLHLNSETARYVLRILAFKAILQNPQDFGFYLEPKDFYQPIKTHSIEVDTTVSNIAAYAQEIGTNYHVLKTLNPWIMGNQLEVDKRSYIIKAPLK